MKWLSTVREQLVRMGAGSEAYDAKWAVFLLVNISMLINPQCFLSLIPKKTYEIIKPGLSIKNMDKSASIRIEKEAMYNASLQVS